MELLSFATEVIPLRHADHPGNKFSGRICRGNGGSPPKQMLRIASGQASLPPLYLLLFYFLFILFIGGSPSGKAAAFEAAIRRFESFPPSHEPLTSFGFMAAPTSTR